ncbi:MAG: DUF4352 domain-containing protein [Corynebacteriales bacterium]|nr:DUF4352 domain-containing protein [Mycobacteriales bacterium]
MQPMPPADQNFPGQVPPQPQGPPAMAPAGQASAPPMSPPVGQPPLSAPPAGAPGQATLVGPPPHSRVFFIVLAIFAGVFVFGAMLGAAANAFFDDEVDGELGQRLQERTTGEGKVGQKMIDQTGAFTVENYECGLKELSSSSSPGPLETDGQFCLVTVLMENRDKENNYGLYAGNQLGVDAQGNTYQASTGAGSYVEDAGDVYGVLAPNEKRTVVLVFELEADATLAKLEFHDKSESNDKGVTVVLN